MSDSGREFLGPLELPQAARERIEVALALVEAIDRQLAPFERELRRLARHQPGCRALMGHYGIGELTAPTILCEFGDVGHQAVDPDKPGRPRNDRTDQTPTAAQPFTRHLTEAPFR